jgi:uncharacterized membrane protein
MKRQWIQKYKFNAQLTCHQTTKELWQGKNRCCEAHKNFMIKNVTDSAVLSFVLAGDSKED